MQQSLLEADAGVAPSFGAARMRRIGMLTPSSNTVLEPVCAAMLAGLEDVSVHFARFRVTEISLTDEALGQFSSDSMLEAAAMLADARVDVICWNGTSAAWLDQDRALCGSIQTSTGIPATSSVLAMVAALRRAGLKRVGLVTPYIDRVQSRIIENLAAEGFEIVAERHMGLSENFAFAGVTQDALADMIRQVASAEPEAILVLCTNLRAAPMVDALEREGAIPILDSVATAVLGAFQVIGRSPGQIERYGRVFAGLGRGRGAEGAR
jgi:maleate isomerase